MLVIMANIRASWSLGGASKPGFDHVELDEVALPDAHAAQGGDRLSAADDRVPITDRLRLPQSARAAAEAWEECGLRIVPELVARLGGEMFPSPGVTDEKVYFRSAAVCVEEAEGAKAPPRQSKGRGRDRDRGDRDRPERDGQEARAERPARSTRPDRGDRYSENY